MNPTAQNSAVILIANMDGLNELSVHLPSGKLSPVMNDCFGFVIKKIELYGGTVSNLDGENIKAVFGIPEPLKDAGIKAVESALDLVAGIKMFNEVKELPYPVSLRIGLEMGPVIVSKTGIADHSQYNVFGETVNTATRIRDFAEKNQVLAGSNLHASVQKQFEFLTLEPIPVKGQKIPMPVFELTGRTKKQINTEPASGRMITSEMVGRYAGLEQLQNGIFDLMNGKGSVISVTGKAGIGKSRLMAEIRQKELMKKVALFEGRAFSNGKNLSFHPIIQIIKSWAEIREEDTSQESIVKLGNGIRRIYPEAFDEIFPFIATMMGYRLEGKAKDRIKGIEGEALENLILKNLRDLLSRATTIRPVMIVIEDAHWCDISSVIIMESLFKLVRKDRILFVNIFRPGHQETGGRISRFLEENLKEHYQEIRIEPLTDKESDELIHNLLNKISLPDEINSLIIDRAAGNPFFIEEVIRSFIDEGLIEVKDDKFLLTENIRYANIPESIDNVLLSRIDRLDGKTKELLKTASVIGRNFYYKVLEEAAQTIEEMDHKLEYLKDVQLINERKTKDEVEFLFKHALAQQATYESIVEKTKKELHLKIANSIEKVFAGRIHEFYGMLAHHYSKAGQAEKTEQYLIKAGDESMRSGASTEAVTFLKKALHLCIQQNEFPDPQKVVDLQEKLFYANFACGQYIEADKYYDLVRSYYFKPYPKTEFRRKIYLIYCLLLRYYVINFYKFIPDAMPGELIYKLLKINSFNVKVLTTINPVKMFYLSTYGYRFVVLNNNVFKKNIIGSFHSYLIFGESVGFLFAGKFFKMGQRVLEKSEKYITEEYNEGYLIGKLGQAFLAYYAGKKLQLKDEDDVLNYSIRIGEYWHPIKYYLVSGCSQTEWGNEQLVLRLLDMMKKLSEAFENSITIMAWHRLNGYQNIKFRKFDELQKISERSVELAIKTNNTLVLFMTFCFRSMMFSLNNELKEAESNLFEAGKILKGIKIPITISQYLIAKSYFKIAEIYLQEDHEPVKKILLKTTKELIHHVQKVKALLTEAYRLHAIAHWLKGNTNKAELNFKRSIQNGQNYGYLELSRTYFEAGKFLRDPKNKKDRINGMNGTECLMKAKAMFEEMNLQWDLKEYEKYMEGGSG
ncbi:MAG: AAA family ATPase [Bacteroidales bacterium]|nr:AAA family ATPase [Bacteroidales bacterium]